MKNIAGIMKMTKDQIESRIAEYCEYAGAIDHLINFYKEKHRGLLASDYLLRELCHTPTFLKWMG